jgi:hypothetical protein
MIIDIVHTQMVIMQRALIMHSLKTITKMAKVQNYKAKKKKDIQHINRIHANFH